MFKPVKKVNKHIFHVNFIFYHKGDQGDYFFIGIWFITLFTFNFVSSFSILRHKKDLDKDGDSMTLRGK